MRNEPLTGKNGKVSASPATLHRETAANGEKVVEQLVSNKSFASMLSHM